MLDEHSSALLGVPAEQVLDALMFSGSAARCKQVFVAGDQVLADNRVSGAGSESDLWNELAQDFARTMKTLRR